MAASVRDVLVEKAGTELKHLKKKRRREGML